MQTFRKTSLIVFVAYIAVVAVGFEIQTRIINGQRVRDIRRFSYQLSFWQHFKNNGTEKYICGAVLISADVALTAGHCCDENDPNIEWRVEAGTAFLHEGIFRNAKCKLHPKYKSIDDPYPDYDLAILRLSEPYELNEFIQPVQLPQEDIKEGFFGWVSGWGAIELPLTPYSYPHQLRAVEIPVTNYETCEKDYEKIEYVLTPRSFCAGNRQTNESACYGDSGGPFVKDDILYGLVSWGYECHLFGLPVAFANIYILKDFIYDETGLY